MNNSLVSASYLLYAQEFALLRLTFQLFRRVMIVKGQVDVDKPYTVQLHVLVRQRPRKHFYLIHD